MAFKGGLREADLFSGMHVSGFIRPPVHRLNRCPPEPPVLLSTLDRCIFPKAGVCIHPPSSVTRDMQA